MKSQINKIKNHVAAYKSVYIVGGVGIALGVVVGYSLKFRSLNNSNVVSPLININSPVTINQDIIQSLVRRGHPGNVIRCIETGESFASVRRASEILSLSRTGLMNHLKGLQDTVGGFTFEVLGEAAK